MTRYNLKMLLPLLLALVMVVTMLPMTALAAEETELTDTQTETVCTEVGCEHELEESTEAATSDEYLTESDTVVADVPAEEETPTEMLSESTEAGTEDAVPPSVDDTIASSWELQSDGTLLITGYIEPFYSPEEQPWQDVRESITSLRFNLADGIEFYDICFWLDGCANLTSAAIPASVGQISPDNFTDCSALQTLTYGGVDVLSEITADYDGHEDEITLMTSSNCGVTRCTCTGSCVYGYRNYRVASESNNYHIMTVYCATCGMTDGIIVSGNHSYGSNGCCTLCGYYNSAYDTTICYHTSTTTQWLTSCRWQEVCSNCGAVVSSGTSHGPYTYGSWTYCSLSQHRRSYTCSYGDSGTYYEYGSHLLTTKYEQCDSTQHSVRSYCSTCGSYVGSTVYANHSFTYSEWTPYNETQHQRTGSCSDCSYTASDFGEHTDTDGDGRCDDCGYEMTWFSVTVPASLTMTVSKYGEVYTADNAAIVNNSTGAIAVTSVTVSTENGWTLVPYSTNMAKTKVDSKLIGFMLNGAQSALSGSTETLNLISLWSIPQGSSLPLAYDAVVSALSVPVSEQVLTVVFVLEWAAQ